MLSSSHGVQFHLWQPIYQMKGMVNGNPLVPSSHVCCIIASCLVVPQRGAKLQLQRPQAPRWGWGPDACAPSAQTSWPSPWVHASSLGGSPTAHRVPNCAYVVCGCDSVSSCKLGKVASKSSVTFQSGWKSEGPTEGEDLEDHRMRTGKTEKGW